MIDFDIVAKESIKEHNPNWPQIPDHPYRIFICKIYLYATIHLKQNINF